MIENLKKNLSRLRCTHIINNLEIYLKYAQDKELSYLSFLSYVAENECNGRSQTQINLQIRRSKFPVLKSFDEFDFKYQHSVTKRMITEWKTFTWIDNRENKIFMGPPGVGKTHIAIALGYDAILSGYKVIFYNMNDLIDDMIIANNENTFKNWISKLVKNDLIIIDEIGYLPIKEVNASLFFKLISELYEFRSVIITSNRMFQEWGESFGDSVITTAIVDRLVHHAETLLIEGDSYRMKGKI